LNAQKGVPFMKSRPDPKALLAEAAKAAPKPAPKKLFDARVHGKKMGPEPHAGGVEVKAAPKPAPKGKKKAAPPAKTPAKWASFDPKQAAATLLAKHTA
jgi:hypothetical protein